MKKLSLITALLLLTGFGIAVEEYDGPEDQPHIMGSGSSASSTAAVGPNGTEYESTVKMQGRSAEVVNDSVINLSTSENGVSFDGSIEASTPCHVIESEVKETGEQSYILDIRTVKEDSRQMCTAQVVMIEYEASFEKEAPYTLEVRHNGEEIREIVNDPEEDDQESTEDEESGLFNWLMNLF